MKRTVVNKLLLVCCFSVFYFTLTAQTKTLLFQLGYKGTSDSSQAWLVLTDNVMQGNSQAEIVQTDSSIFFRGKISIENNAGVVQLISPLLDTTIAQYKGVRLRVRGDSSEYILALLPDTYTNHPQHLEYRFTALPSWYNIQIPFDVFVSAYLDVPLLTEKPLTLERVRRLCIINAYQEGRFNIEIDYIGLY